MKISIVTVCYNAAKTLEYTIQSVLAQDYGEIEYIIVDGGSTDGTPEILNRYRERVDTIISGKDNGIYDAMNKGIRLATGEVIGLLNADDVFAGTQVVSTIAREMQENGLDAIYADCVFVDDVRPDHIIRRYHSAPFAPARIARGWMPAHPTLYLRRKVYEQFGLYKTDYKIAGDFEFIARIFKDGSLRAKHVDEVWVKMRCGGVSTQGLRSTLCLNSEVYRACKENAIATSRLKILSKYPRKLLDFVCK